jgi:hydroxymethylpyrimidine pyrophosphatase-like HAD family hydrolase
MTAIPKKLIMFDLDGTLAVSKQSLDPEMAGLIRELLNHYKVCIISGGALPQFQKQILTPVQATVAQLDNFVLMPTTSANIYVHKEGQLERVFSAILTDDEKSKITKYLEQAIEFFHLRPETA